MKTINILGVKINNILSLKPHITTVEKMTSDVILFSHMRGFQIHLHFGSGWSFEVWILVTPDLYMLAVLPPPLSLSSPWNSFLSSILLAVFNIPLFEIGVCANLRDEGWAWDWVDSISCLFVCFCFFFKYKCHFLEDSSSWVMATC